MHLFLATLAIIALWPWVCLIIGGFLSAVLGGEAMHFWVVTVLLDSFCGSFVKLFEPAGDRMLAFLVAFLWAILGPVGMALVSRH